MPRYQSSTRNLRVALPFCHFTLRGRKPPPDGYPVELRTLGDHLRAKRLDLGLLQRDVAEQLRVSKATVYNWENNRSSPALHLVPRIIGFLGYVPYDTQLESLGQQIVAARRRLGFSQKGLARRLGVDSSALGRWEHDGAPVSSTFRQRLNAFLAGQALDGQASRR